jgi:cytochrome c biogenesis protein CcmG/thiol:disulfide interchange protein DsbE
MSDTKNKKLNKTIATLFFVFIILGVFYFVYRAIQSDYSPDLGDIQNQTGKISEMATEGLQDFQAPAINNTTFKLSQLNHKVVIINFWASWCGPCVEEIPSLLKLVNETNGQVALVAISLDTDEKQMMDFLKNYDFSNPNIFMLKDPNYTLAENFGTFKLPESYMLNKDRKLIKKISGSIDWADPDILALINSELQK